MSDNGFLQKYQDNKTELQRRLDSIQRVFMQHGVPRLLSEISILQQKLQSNQFNLVVMGQFKRGKSTLINALLGSEVLPTAVVPLTSVVTIVQFGEIPRATVYFQNGQHQQIHVDSLADYTTERKNPQNQKRVDRVQVEYPATLLCDGVRLIDTPGVGSVFEHNTSTAYEFLPHADAVLFLITADPPISEAELKFLANVREHAVKIFFIKNKMDHLTSEDLQESLDFTREVLAKEMRVRPAALKIFPLSARWALEGRLQSDKRKLAQSRLGELEQVLSEFLLHEKGRLLLKSIQRRARRLLKEAGGLVDLESKAISIPQAELAQKIVGFQEYQSEIQHQKEVLEHVLKGGVRRILERYDEEVTRFKKEKLPEIAEKLRWRFRQESHGGAKKMATVMEVALREELEAVFVPWRQQQAEEINQKYTSLAERLVKQVNADIDRIYATAGGLFDIHLERYEREEQLAGERFFYFKYDRAASMLEDFENLLTYTFATLVSKNIILKKVLARLPELFDRQCGRVRADFGDRLRESSFALQGQLKDRMDEAFAEIQSLVEKARLQHESEVTESSSRFQELQQCREQIRQIEQQLEQIQTNKRYEAEIPIA